jgi:hypothetical protein
MPSEDTDMILWMKYNLESTWATFLFGGLTMARDYLVEGALKGLGYQPFMDRVFAWQASIVLSIIFGTVRSNQLFDNTLHYNWRNRHFPFKIMIKRSDINMNWFMQLFRGGNRNVVRNRTILMSLLTLAGGAMAYGAARRRNMRNVIPTIMQPLRNRLFR